VRTVVLIGAGSSLAQAKSYRAHQSREHPPLDATFFDKSWELAQRDNDLQSFIATFRRRLDADAQFADPWDASYIGSLEQFFADVYYEVVSHRSTRAFNVLKSLLRLYMRILAATTNWMAVRPDEAVIGHIIRREMRTAGADELTLVTFNQDLVLENIVARVPRSRDRWCLESLYGDVGLSVITRRGEGRFPLHGPRCRHKPIRLFKLHGSLNWWLRTREAEPSLSTLFPTDRNKPVFVSNDREASGDVEKIQSQTATGRKTWYLWPLLVPPIYDKQRITGMAVLQEVWDAAEKAIREAQRLVMIGYSLPDADVLARQMLRRAYVRNSNLVSVDCVNPSTAVVEKLKTALDCKVVKMFNDADTFLAYGSIRGE
jgi:hypothetical protein